MAVSGEARRTEGEDWEGRGKRGVGASEGWGVRRKASYSEMGRKVEVLILRQDTEVGAHLETRLGMEVEGVGREKGG